MEKRFMGYSTKEIDALLEVLRKENEDLKRRDTQMAAELSRMKEERGISPGRQSGEEDPSRDEALIETLKAENGDLKQQLSEMAGELSRMREEAEVSDSTEETEVCGNAEERK